MNVPSDFTLIVIFLGLELLSLPLYILAAFQHDNPKSLEATWKYLLICSVGIALALLGSFFLAYASIKNGLPPSLLTRPRACSPGVFSSPWLWPKEA